MATPQGTRNIEVEKKGKGRPKSIESEEAMWNYFLDYGTQTKATPIMVHDFVGKDGDSVERRKERPLTLEGFYNYLDNQGIITDATDYFENKENRYKDFVRVCLRIRRTIKQDQIEGGMAGIYNPSITQRLNGLTEKSEVKTDNTHLLTGKVSVNVITSGIPLSNRETDVDAG